MMSTFNLDTVDRKILRILQEQADISHAALAEAVGASPASCWRRIKALDTAGVLGKAVRLVNPDLVGRGLNVFCHVRMKSHDLVARRSFERFVESHEEVLECYSMSGEWDYLLRVVVADVADYERLLMHGILTHDAVANSSSHFALKSVKYSTAVPV
ncbi:MULTISPECIES: Lrp/AsnC family transcriptional regulator [Sinorhizobium]|uniref:AsnC family transcriptional regulator n=2 Tax=Sinorhizobium TaxID=28105 RepID=A0A2S3YRP5_9HYPH|nr:MULTISPECIES: Lrp/AsnC family transcriptional regulator [Sinorhizobium]AUX80339.1 AsnC family transcriptional regulator protein [Sinorhizobium fredii]PDT43299.1 AsnC family transcriptional regulator [Sinorhizobium sp. FG01]PDT52845.1 AsnC family transcriptional regulator [Sinorhizobium sp. NG07B]POH29016.1 AsnC family transcriptional regulator [Sinorhizobium americanum]POH34301.1 AsnC family transcriptional regulator [Sinorhizobium americanum]